MKKDRTPVRFKNLTSAPTNVIGPDELTLLIEGKPEDPFSMPFRKFVDESIQQALKNKKPGTVESWKTVVRETVNESIDAFFNQQNAK